MGQQISIVLNYPEICGNLIQKPRRYQTHLGNFKKLLLETMRLKTLSPLPTPATMGLVMWVNVSQAVIPGLVETLAKDKVIDGQSSH
jgi:hypothetical protein